MDEVKRFSDASECCVYDLFEEQVRLTPEAHALVLADQQLTYQQLDGLANRLALHLQSAGVKADTPVGLWSERLPEVFIGLLAILKSGGCYVPLDPDYPAERLRFMLEDSAAPLLLVSKNSVDKLPQHNAQVLILEALHSDLGNSSENLDTECRQYRDSNPMSLAYLIYTSGSTGKPKGVAMPHKPLVNLLDWQKKNSLAGLATPTLQYSSLSFDVSFQEIFSTWCSGGVLVLTTKEKREDPWLMWEQIQREKIERLFLPFVALQQLATARPTSTANDSSLRLKEIITAGEQLRSTPEIRAMFEQLSHCSLSNHYGPSETHVVTAYKLSGPAKDWPILPPIGQPISNTVVYILSKQLQPTPIGVAGEIYIGGVPLAREYLRNPELTRERFISNPFHERSGRRLYRTGDLARWMPDGNIEFLGRVDKQIKIRGYRVEPGEVEAALENQPGVSKCIVEAHKFSANQTSENRLVAYLVPDKNKELPTIEELREKLKLSLPDYMIPATFISLDAVPLTPSGKIDKEALPPPESNRPAEKPPIVNPGSPTEQILLDIWRSVLEISELSVHDNFFDLGGHSILATRVMNKIMSQTGKHISITALFENATISDLAKLLSAPEESVKTKSLVVLQPEGEKPPLFCMHGWGGDVYSFLDIGRHLAPDRPVYGLQAVGIDGKTARHTSVEAMVEHYIKEMLISVPHGPYNLIGYSAGGWVAYAVAQKLRGYGETVNLCILDSRMSCRIPLWLYLPLKSIYLAYRIPYHLRNLMKLTGDELIDYIRTKSRILKLKLIPERESEQTLQERSTEISPSSEADYFASVVQNYSPEPYSGDLTLFSSQHTRWFDRLFWRFYIKGKIRVHRIKGEHLEIIMPENVEYLANKLKLALDEFDSQ
jgi:amino acid adenylation domain-containing protein